MSEPRLFGYVLYRESRDQLLNEIDMRISDSRFSAIISLNTLKLYLGEKNPELKDCFDSGTHIIPDGQSMVIADYLINCKRISAISGAELMVALIARAEMMKYRLFFLGAEESLLLKVRNKLKLEFPWLYLNSMFQHGFYKIEDEAEVIERIAKASPDILFVAFGSPRKERFIITNQSRLNTKVLMGVGGSYEYFVGEIKLGTIAKRLGLRWFVRLINDPRRLFIRYFKCNSYYIFAVIRELFFRVTR
ncbi:MAG: WecB/TagA/CpsF family glycosyltransferase [Bacteroidia bacterium]|nr:WecB/TagA/CpsF family glycosyltransferase [Bacteroidia bacterium]